MSRKQEMRRRFREAVFKRDRYRCIACGFQSSSEKAEQELDAHHITPRDLLPNGGYVAENGATLCDPSKLGGPAADGCHFKAEGILDRIARSPALEPKTDGEDDYEYSPRGLYAKIGSSLEKATRVSERLSSR